MTIEIALRASHFIGLLLLFAALFSEYQLLAPELSRKVLRKLSYIDALYGIMAIVVVGAGLAMWFGWGKGSDFYTKNPIFLIKISLAGFAGILSLYPTIFFLRERSSATKPQEELVVLPRAIRLTVVAQMLIYLCLPVLASLMARGIGLG